MFSSPLLESDDYAGIPLSLANAAIDLDHVCRTGGWIIRVI
jgi:hypothetical protein